MGAGEKEEYLLPGDMKEGGRFSPQRSAALATPSGVKAGRRDRSRYPSAILYQSISTGCSDVNHWPEMWGRWRPKSSSSENGKKEMADLFAFLYFIRYMDEPVTSEWKGLMETNTVTNAMRS